MTVEEYEEPHAVRQGPRGELGPRAGSPQLERQGVAHLRRDASATCSSACSRASATRATRCACSSPSRRARTTASRRTTRTSRRSSAPTRCSTSARTARSSSCLASRSAWPARATPTASSRPSPTCTTTRPTTRPRRPSPSAARTRPPSRTSPRPPRTRASTRASRSCGELVGSYKGLRESGRAAPPSSNSIVARRASATSTRTSGPAERGRDTKEMTIDERDAIVGKVYRRLMEIESRLLPCGLHTVGVPPTAEEAIATLVNIAAIDRPEDGPRRACRASSPRLDRPQDRGDLPQLERRRARRRELSRRSPRAAARPSRAVRASVNSEGAHRGRQPACQGHAELGHH